jgi:23S rRNA pseudouridine1911/1915/1917 synthase
MVVQGSGSAGGAAGAELGEGAEPGEGGELGEVELAEIGAGEGAAGGGVVGDRAECARGGAGGGRSLVEWLRRSGRGTRTATFAPSPAHRLDRGTSGLVAIGLSPLGLAGLAAAFRDGRVAKAYTAVVEGVPRPPRGTIDAPLRVVAAADARRPKVVVDAGGKPARTDFRVVERGARVALVHLVPHTGRTHQLRAHLAHLGHPIAGDRRYGARLVGVGRLMLHAAELTLPHPRSGARVHCEEPPPASFAALLRGHRRR